MSGPDDALPAGTPAVLVVGRHSGFSLQTLLGLPLLWASAFFVPALRPASLFLLPSNDLFGLIVVPTLVVVAGGAALLGFAAAIYRWFPPRVVTAGAIIGLALFGVISLKVLLGAFGYAWEELLPVGGDYLLMLRLVKYGVCAAMIAAVWATRGALPRWNRLFGNVGIALGMFAVLRLLTLWWLPPGAPAPPGAAATLPRSAGTRAVVSGAAPIAAEAGGRRVVWVLFDETDFGRVYGALRPPPGTLPNFSRLADVALFATHANSPASATLYSIPALLTGVPLRDPGVRIDPRAGLSLETGNRRAVPFTEATSLFGALAAAGHSASVLGFYLPYCKLFQLQRCDSFPWPQAGGLDAAVWTNVPDFVVSRLRLSRPTGPAYFGTITRRLLQLLPSYLERDDALTFVHLNIPHLPSTYADAVLNLPASPDPVVGYSRNLLVADRILGEIISTSERQASRHELVLIVSSDHWLRKEQSRSPGPEVAKPIPFIVWKVGDTQGLVLSAPVSTVHTGAMILAYLGGEISTQSDFARWWREQSVDPSFIAPGT